MFGSRRHGKESCTNGYTAFRGMCRNVGDALSLVDAWSRCMVMDRVCGSVAMI